MAIRDNCGEHGGNARTHARTRAAVKLMTFSFGHSLERLIQCPVCSLRCQFDQQATVWLVPWTSAKRASCFNRSTALPEISQLFLLLPALLLASDDVISLADDVPLAGSHVTRPTSVCSVFPVIEHVNNSVLSLGKQYEMLVSRCERGFKPFTHPVTTR